MKTRFQVHEAGSDADAWLPETVEVSPEDDYVPAIARVKGTVRKTPAAIILEQDRRALANHLPFWDDTPEDLARRESSWGQPGDCQYSI